jgi:putative ABC transport system permease protein
VPDDGLIVSLICNWHILGAGFITMLLNFLKIAYRNLLKNKVFSIVNIFGLAIGMAACFFIFAYVHFESSYDGFHKNVADLYRVNVSFGGSFGGFPAMSTNHPATGPAMKQDFPEVKDYARVAPPSLFLSSTTITYTDAKGQDVTLNQEKMFIADPGFLRMFSFPFVAGNPATALNDEGSIVISASMANKYFGRANALGKMLTLNRQLPLKVTGVFKDVPENSHLKFDMLVPFKTFISDKFGYTSWDWPEFYTYVQLAPGTDPAKIAARFPAFVEHYLGNKQRELNYKTYLHLQPLGEIHLRSGETRGPEPGGSEKEVYFLTLIGVLILVIAWINYINLSTAKSVERAKEVGLRKVVGGLRRQVIGQFILESVLVNLLALGVAVLIVLVCFPYFGSFIGKAIDQGTASSGIWHAPMFWLATLSVYLVSAFLVGAYPAFVLSSFRPAAVLKGKFGNSGRGIFLRKSLVVVQFVLSLLLIAGSITVYSQLSFMQHESLGYDKDQILVVKAPAFTDSTFGERARVFEAGLRQDPSVRGIAPSSDIPGKTVVERNGLRQATQDKTHNYLSFLTQVNEQFLGTYGMPLAAGRNLNRSDTVNPFTTNGRSGKIRVMVNERVVQAMGYKSNEAAVNQDIIFSYGPGELSGQIVGVVRNYHQRSLKDAYDPMLYWYPAYDNWRYFSVQVKADHLPQTLARIEHAYKDVFAGNPYEYFFLNEYFGRQYESDQRFGKVFGLFTGLAIFVACLGLLGLSAFMIRLRTKETGIRKVLGASIYSLMILFSKDFVKLVAVATVIAVPLVYWGASQWLRNYAFHIRLEWFIFVGPPLLLLTISLLMIGVQSLKTAMANPVDSLKTE